MSSGDLGGIGIGAEVTPGTGVAVDGWLNTDASGADIGKGGPIIDEGDLLGSSQPQARARGIWAEGGNSFKLNFAGSGGALETLLEHFYGAKAGTSTLTFTESDSRSIPTVSVWKDYAVRVVRSLGCVATELSYNFAPGWVQMGASYQGMSVDHPTPVTVAPPSPATLVHTEDVTAFTIGGVSFAAVILGGQASLTAPVTSAEQSFAWGSSSAAQPEREGARKKTCSFELLVKDTSPDVTALIDEWEANTNHGDVVVGFTSGGKSHTLTLGSLQGSGNRVQLAPGVVKWTLAGVPNTATHVWVI